ncbi:glycosyltransferase [Marinilabiliaceae bacterium JC040]|nr:glycosyltransferase [Marinilabiliaceae bacterium JC040]
MEKKKVIIITYYWPPAGGPGVQRWLKFSKFLPDSNIEPIIICPKEDKAEYPIRDKSLINDISSETRVFPTENKSLYGLYKKLTKAKTAPYSGFANESNPSFKQKIARFIRGNFFLPDSRKSWNKYAFKKACELIEKENIKTVITTSPPHSSQLIGLELKKKYNNIHWIADLRDPWTDIYYYNNFYPTKLAKYIDTQFEKQVLIKSDIVISVSEYIKKQFILKSSKINKEKVIVIPNGYDEDDFHFENKKKNECFTISYTGTLASNYDISTFIKVLKGINFKYKLQFVGKIDEKIKKILIKELGDNVSFKNFVPHSESINYLINSDLLLLVIPVQKDNEGILTGKLFEYIGSNIPIICLGPTHGDAAKIIKDAKAGETFEYNNFKDISEYINILEQKEHTEENTNRKLYSRKNLSLDLSKYIQ